MSQLVRGIAWRKGQAVTLFALATVVIAGCLVAAQFSDLTDTPPGAVGVLLLLGVVALSVQAAASARSRRPEIALAQIRGRRGARLFAYFLAEPITVLVLAGALGVVVGRFVTGVAADRWLQVDRAQAQDIGHLGWTTVAVALAASVGAVVAGSWRTLREPLVEQLDTAHRPRASSTLVLFGQTVVIVAAGIAAYQASQNAGSRDGWAGIANPALLSPILLGLAAGQLAAWGLQATAAVSTRRTGDPRRIGSFLATRRMARRSDTVFGTRLVIAAAVVTAVTASATTAVHAWQDESTRLALGGPRQYPVENGALAAYLASHEADPDGTWLMAMVSAPDESERYRRMFADTARWDAVVGDFLDDTGAADVDNQIGALHVGDEVEPIKATTASVTVTNASMRLTTQVAIIITYGSTTGVTGNVKVPVPTPKTTTRGSTTATVKLPGCRTGCVPTAMSTDGFRQAAGRGEIVFTDIRLGDSSLLDQMSWHSDPTSYLQAEQDGGALTVQVDQFGDTSSLSPDVSRQNLAALTTSGLDLDATRKGPVIYAVDGSDHPAEVVGHADSFPFVGRTGALLDLPRAMAGGSTTIAQSSSSVVAREDTPESVLDALDQTGVVGKPREFSTSLDQAERRANAQGVRLYMLMSAFAAMIALVGLASAVAGQRGERQHEAASLRVTGVRARHIRAAHRREALWLSVCAVVAVAVTGWVAARLTLDGLSLVPESAYAPVLKGSPQLSTVALVAVGAGLLVGVVTLVVNRRIARSSPPSMLRDEVSG